MRKTLVLILTVLLVCCAWAKDPPASEKEKKFLGRFSFDFLGKQKISVRTDSTLYSLIPVMGFDVGIAQLAKRAILFEGQLGFHSFNADTDELSYLRIKQISTIEVLLGPRFLPVHPLLEVGRIGVRPTLLAQAGPLLHIIDTQLRYGLTACLTAGLFFSKGGRLSGPMVEFGFYPFKEKIELSLFQHPRWFLRLSWVFGPKR